MNADHNKIRGGSAVEKIPSIASNSILLNIQMLADPMGENGWEYAAHLADRSPCLRSCQLYWGQQDLNENVLYLVPEDQAERFPANRFSYITTGDLCGNAPHIRNVGVPFGQVFNLVLTTFQRYYDFESKLGDIMAGDGSLTELSRMASDFFHNPVYIHDDMFSVLAISHREEGMLQFEYDEKTNRIHIPLWLINEYKFDDSYIHTLQRRHAGIWEKQQYPEGVRSLYVNLWDGPRYCGRLLIDEISSALQPGQYYAAEYLANHVMALLRKLEHHHYRNYDFEELLIALLSGKKVDRRSLRTMLSILDWTDKDQYLCLMLQNQDRNNSVRVDSALNSLLSSLLPGSVTFRHQQCLCIIVNITNSGQEPAQIRQCLAPHIRDSVMYGGISNPVDGICAIDKGFAQADIALNYIAQEDSSEWMVSFSACAMPYIRRRACSELPGQVLAHPVLLKLQNYDREFGTQYYETLRVFLTFERNIPQVSQQLIIHRTTLTYRLGKIQELTKLNLDDPSLRLHLLLSFYLLDQTSRDL